MSSFKQARINMQKQENMYSAIIQGSVVYLTTFFIEEWLVDVYETRARMWGHVQGMIIIQMNKFYFEKKSIIMILLMMIQR